jgi:hypothetical protein
VRGLGLGFGLGRRIRNVVRQPGRVRRRRLARA